MEGYLFPETYSFPRAVTAEDAIQAMTRGLRDALVRLQEEVNPDFVALGSEQDVDPGIPDRKRSGC